MSGRYQLVSVIVDKTITANKKHMGVHISYPGNLKREKIQKCRIIFFFFIDTVTHFINFRFEIKKPKKDLHRGQNDHDQKKHMGVHISDPGHLKRKKIQNVIWFFIYLSTQWPIFIIFISKLHSQTKITANKKHMGVHISYPGNLKRKKIYKIIFFLYRHNDTFYKFSFQNYRAQKRSTSWTKWSRPIIWESTFHTQETWKGKKNTKM